MRGGSPLEAKARGEEWENVEAEASAWAVPGREREAGRRFGGEEGRDGWAPPVSRERERGKGEPASWAWPKRKKGGRGGFGPKGRIEGRGERKIPFSFFKRIFNAFSNWIFLFKLTFVFKTLIT